MIKRILAAAFGLLTLVTACTTSGGTAAPPTLAQVQAWVNSVAAELPSVGSTLQSTGTLTGANLDNFNKAIAALQAELPTLNALKPGATNTQQVIQAIGSALTIAAGFIPSAAPFSPLIAIAVALVEGFMASQPVTVAGMPVPATPPAQAAVHAAAVAHRQINN